VVWYGTPTSAKSASPLDVRVRPSVPVSGGLGDLPTLLPLRATGLARESCKIGYPAEWWMTRFPTATPETRIRCLIYTSRSICISENLQLAGDCRARWLGLTSIPSKYTLIPPTRTKRMKDPWIRLLWLSCSSGSKFILRICGHWCSRSTILVFPEANQESRWLCVGPSSI